MLTSTHQLLCSPAPRPLGRCLGPGLHQRASLACSSRSYKAAADPVVSTDWLTAHLDEVSILDVRGRVDTAAVEPGVEVSQYLAEYDAYLEGHIPVS